jgi:hypothetical protein
MPGDTAWLASPVAAKLPGNGLNRLRGNYRIFWTGNLGMSSLSRKWAISSTVAFALVFFASIFVFYSRSPPGVTGSRSNGAILSNRSFGVWMTEFSGSVEYQNSAYTRKKIDPAQIGFSLPFKFDQPLPWVRVFYNGKTVEGPLVDVGPGGTNNPFWNEKDGNSPTVGKGNGAGLDATPAAWDAIGIGKGDPARGKVKVDFELIARE